MSTPRRLPTIVPFLLIATAICAVPDLSPAQQTIAPLRCGDREPRSYVVVLDASSSLHSDNADRTADQYERFVDLLNEFLCEGDRLRAFAFPPDSNTDLREIRLGASEVDFHSIHNAIRGVSDIRTGHTDLRLTLRRIRREIPPAGSIVFLLTDGSVFPLNPSNRADPRAYVREVRQLSREARQLRAEDYPLFVVGIGASEAKAIDRDAVRDWRHRRVPTDLPVPGFPTGFDLAEAWGEDLLRAIFRDRYVPDDSVSLARWLFQEDDDLARFVGDYRRIDSLWIRHLDRIPLRHLLLSGSREGDSDPCGSFDPRPGIRSIPGDLRGGTICSVDRPTREEVRHLLESTAGGGDLAPRLRFLADSAFAVEGIPDSVFGTHQLAVGPNGECQDVLRQHLAEGKPWYSPARISGTVELHPLDPLDGPRTLRMAEVGTTGCSVALQDTGGAEVPAGKWLALFRMGSLVGIRVVEVLPPVLVHEESEIFGGGFPFLAHSRPVRVKGCILVSEREMARFDDPVVRIVVPGRSLLLDENPDECLPGPGQQAWHIHHITLPSANVHSALLVIGPRSDSLAAMGASTWYALDGRRNSAFFLSLGHTALWLVLGSGLYLVKCLVKGTRPSRPRILVYRCLYLGMWLLIAVQSVLWIGVPDAWRVEPFTIEVLREFVYQVLIVCAVHLIPIPSAVGGASGGEIGSV